MLHVYQCCSIPQSCALAWGISWHKIIFLQPVQHAALLVICTARAYMCLGSAARAWFIACHFKYVFDLASEKLWSSKEVVDWGWEIKIVVNMGCAMLLTQMCANRALWYVFRGGWSSVLLNAGQWSTPRWWACLVLGASLLPGKVCRQSCSETIRDRQPDCNYYITADSPVYDQDTHRHVQAWGIYILSLPWRSWKL